MSEICGKCDKLVSMKGKNRRNREQRADGGWDHVFCDNVSERQKSVALAERREHRDARRLAIQRGDLLA